MKKPQKIQATDLLSGDILLVKSSGFLPRAIRFFQGCEYNHAATVVYLEGKRFVSEADKPGVIFTHLSKYTHSRRYSKLLILRPHKEFTQAQTAAIIELTIDNAGRKGYDFFNLLIAQAIKYITRGRLWIGANKRTGSRRFICGEWCAYMCNYVNPEMFAEWWKVGPAELYNAAGFDKYQLK